MVKKKVTKKENDDKKLFAFLATFLSIVGFLIALIAKKDNKYVMFYAKQSLVIFIAAIIGAAINMIIKWIPIFGWIVTTAINISILVLWILSWVFSLSGEEKKIPLVSEYAEKINV